MEADLQSLLGDAGMAQYKEFTENMGNQEMLTTMTQDFADSPLTATQQQQLLQAMKTAQQSVMTNSPVDLSQANPSNKLAMMEQALQREEQINQNVLQQAGAFLSPDQLQTLASSQSNRMAMQKLGTAMVQEMFSNAPAGP
jgi:hypothetical protein